MAFAVLGSRTEAEDVAQEALARALVRWSRLSGFEEPWTVRVSSNLALDRVRLERRRQRRDASTPTDEGDPDIDRVDLQRALKSLSRRQREVVVLRFLGGFTEREVAGALGCSVGSVKQHSSRGLKGLRSQMGVVDVPTTG